MNTEQRRARWQAICREYRESSETQKAFCRNRGIAVSTLQYWLTKSRNEAQGSAGNELVAVGVTERPESTGSIRIRVDEHITIEVDRPVGTERLTDILRAARAL
jgi:hypothetical protein